MAELHISKVALTAPDNIYSAVALSAESNLQASARRVRRGIAALTVTGTATAAAFNFSNPTRWYVYWASVQIPPSALASLIGGMSTTTTPLNVFLSSMTVALEDMEQEFASANVLTMTKTIPSEPSITVEEWEEI